ncbi:MAG: beta-lactamase family protein [Anaerolineaceae bacterium]|nr:beta-lactamase family protein [Anaerolineaceae bacterium]
MKKPNKKITFGVIVFLVLLTFLTASVNTLSVASATSYSPHGKAQSAVQLHGIIQQHMADYDFSGSVLVAQGDQVLFSEGYGYARRYFGKAQNTPETTFLLGSMTKTFTALAILDLVEAGQIHLEDCVTDLFPEYTLWSEVTLHHLLNHTSGIPNYYEAFPDFIRYFAGHTTPTEIMVRFKDKPLLFAPGADYDYSNTNYMILSAIIEQVTGQSYIDYLNQHILVPWGMQKTGYSEHVGSIQDMAKGYCLGMIVEVTGFNLSNFYGAGGLYSTTEDLFHLQQHIDFKNLVNENSIVAINSEYDYGYGMMQNDSAEFGKIFHISGGGPGINTVMYTFADTGIVVIILSNNQGFDTERLAQDIVRATP